MKNFQELLIETNNFLSEKTKKENIITDIVNTLELTEKYLGRKLNTSEIRDYTNVLLEEVDEKKTESKQQFAKGKYTIEISTSDGKLIKTATSQQGILNVIHGERQYRVLDGNNRDITAKLKAFIKEKQKQQEIKKKYAKRKKRRTTTNESVDSQNITLNEGLGALVAPFLKPLGKAAFKSSLSFLDDVATDLAIPAIRGGVRGGGRSAMGRRASNVASDVIDFIEPKRVVRVPDDVLDSGPTPPATPAAQTLEPPTAKL